MSSTDEKSKSTDKEAAISLMLKSFDKTIGKGVVQLLSGQEVSSISRVSSGVPSLDIAMGGGYARGRIHELYGPESSGKTTLVLEAVREIQKLGGVAAFVDAEHAFDRDYAIALGVDVDKLIFAQPDTGEQALNIVEQLTGSGLVDMVILDSVAALVPEKELNGEVGDSIVGTHARLMSQAMRMLVSKARKNNVVVVFINQIRMKIGVMFGSPETTSGGNALKYFASIRMDIRRAGTKKVGEESVSNVTKVTIKKNKTAPPYRSTEFEIEFGTGVNKEKDLLQLAVTRNVVDKAGAWYSYNGERLGQGEVNTLANLQDNPALFEEIKAKVYDQLKSQMLTESVPDSEEVAEDE